MKLDREPINVPSRREILFMTAASVVFAALVAVLGPTPTETPWYVVAGLLCGGAYVGVFSYVDVPAVLNVRPSSWLKFAAIFGFIFFINVLPEPGGTGFSVGFLSSLLVVSLVIWLRYDDTDEEQPQDHGDSAASNSGS